jgi:hypothetical protein
VEVVVLYAAFIWTKWETEEDLDPEEFMKYAAFNAESADAGVRKAGIALHPVSATTTIRLRDDEVLMTDGPFIESKEQLSGFYVFECDDLDEAIRWAARIPGARHGAIEVRPVLVEHAT